MLSLHWSSSDITALSLVESFIVMLRQISYDIKNQLKEGTQSPLLRAFRAFRWFFMV